LLLRRRHAAVWGAHQLKFDVAFCADSNMEAPLHVAASSLLARTGEGWTVVFHLLLPDFDEARRAKLCRTLDLVQRPYEARFLPAPPESMFAGFRPLHGNKMAYYRLALPDLIDAERLLYVDSDTITFTDVAPLAHLDMAHWAAGFVPRSRVGYYPERAFYARLGLRPETPGLNSGVMLFNLPEWRAQNWTERIFQFCRKYPNDLVAADQTALIATFAGRFAPLDQRYNVHLFSYSAAEDPAQLPGIYHFVGSPKPWDLGGSWIHPAYSLYREGLSATVFKENRNGFRSLANWQRAYRIRGGYYRTLRNRISGSLEKS